MDGPLWMAGVQRAERLALFGQARLGLSIGHIPHFAAIREAHVAISVNVLGVGFNTPKVCLAQTSVSQHSLDN